MKSLNVDLWSPITVETIHETYKGEHTHTKQKKTKEKNHEKSTERLVIQIGQLVMKAASTPARNQLFRIFFTMNDIQTTMLSWNCKNLDPELLEWQHVKWK